MTVTNTGTGGSSSSSDGSSGHASMSDSQTSGSPPAPVADYAKLTGPGSTNYKSVLKSVPEDEAGLGSATRLVLSPEKTDSGHRSGGSNSAGSSGKRSSSKSRNRNKVKKNYKSLFQALSCIFY